MFIRFVSGKIDDNSRVLEGLFCAAAELRWSNCLPDYEFEALIELRDWFNSNLRSPFRYLPDLPRYNASVCWFKSSARQHLARAWELIAILERNDVLIWMIKSEKIGLIHYEDEAQAFAEPYRDVRPLIK